MYSVECMKCKLPFTKRSMKSKQKICHDCLYENSYSKLQNIRVMSNNDELTKQELVAKLDIMDEKMDTLTQTIDAQVKSVIEKLVDEASLEYSSEFTTLKASIVSMQEEHEERMKTLLATVNSRMVAFEKRLEERVVILMRKVRELRSQAKAHKWRITKGGKKNGLDNRLFEVDI